MVFLSNIIKEGELVSFSEWSNYTNNLKKSVKKQIKDEKTAIKIINNNFERAVENRLPKEKFGIFFSGGIDSTYIAYMCKKFTDNFVCYTVGIEGSKDIEWANKVSKKLNLRYKQKILTIKETEKIFENTANILGKNLISIVNLGVGGVIVAAIELAKKDKLTYFFSGLGSEEIFAGYHRHGLAEDINEECWRGLITTYKRDFLRDYKISKAMKVKFLTPFLDKELIKRSMAISGSFKIKSGFKKWILRKAAETNGLEKEFCYRPKKAAQYGSSFDKAILKIAKHKGFKYKKGYLDYLSK